MWTRDREPDRRGATGRSGAGVTGTRPFARPATLRSPEPVRIALLADLHVPPEGPDGPASPFAGDPVERLSAAVEDLADRDADAVVCAGDLAHLGRPAGFDRAADALSGLSAPLFAVPGNHDLGRGVPGGLSPPAFADRFGAGVDPFVRRVGGVDVAGLAAPDGRVPPESVAALWERLGPRPAILVVHHPLAAATGALAATSFDRDLVVDPLSGGGLDRLLGTAPVDLVVGGHLHLSLLAAGTAWSEVVAPPLCTYPAGYLLLDVSPRGTTVRFVPVRTDDRLRDHRRGLSEADRQLADIAADRLQGLPAVDLRSA